MTMKIAIIGTTLIDITFQSKNEIKKHACNKGKIDIALGGSMCNVASRLSSCDVESDFYTILGSDRADDLLASLPEGINIYADIIDKPQPIFMQMNHEFMCCSITPDFFVSHSPLEDSYDLVITDNEDILEELDSVIFSGSIPEKKVKLKGLVINEDECLSTYASFDSFIQDWKDWCDFIIITRSYKGVIYYDGINTYSEASLAGKLTNTLGCGDTFLAGFIVAYSAHKSLQESVEEGQSLVRQLYK